MLSPPPPPPPTHTHSQCAEAAAVAGAAAPNSLSLSLFRSRDLMVRMDLVAPSLCTPTDRRHRRGSSSRIRKVRVRAPRIYTEACALLSY